MFNVYGRASGLEEIQNKQVRAPKFASGSLSRGHGSRGASLMARSRSHAMNSVKKRDLQASPVLS